MSRQRRESGISPRLDRRMARVRLEPLEARSMPAVITPFAVRYTANASGDILFVANTLMTAPSNDPGAVNARNGVGTDVDNNDFNMAYVDVDSDASTFDSSSASLALPAGGTVLFAGLYWGGSSANAARTSVKVKVPGSSAYSSLTGTFLGKDAGDNYQAFVNLTTQVQAAGAGSYTVANVQSTTGSDNHAGWSLVVVVGDPSAPLRNLTVFDGLALVEAGDSDATITISGFKAPASDVVNASIGVVAYEGDRGLTGDSLRLNGQQLTDAANPQTNFFNSSISNKGTRVTTKGPDYLNQLGFDADIVATTGLIARSATSATVQLRTDQDRYLPGVITTAIDLYAPVTTSSQSVVDLNGGTVNPGDVLEYTVNFAVTGGEGATLVNLNDLIPANTAYVPGSLKVATGANAGAKSDATGDDQGAFASGPGRVGYYLGTGATSTAGGTVGVGSSSSITFRVTVAPNTPDGTVIANQASLTFRGQTSGTDFSASSSATSVTVTRASDLALAYSTSNATPDVNGTISLTLALGNGGPFGNTNVAVLAPLPAGLQFVSATPGQGTYNQATGAWSVGSVGSGGSATLTIVARVVGASSITANASVTAADLPDPTSINNTAAVTVVPRVADLRLTKTVSDARPNAGARVTFITTLTNRGPDAASNIAVADLLPAGFTLVSATASSGSYASASGNWSLASLATNGSATLTIVADVTGSTASIAQASVTAADQYDSTPANNIASVSVTPQRADLGVAVAVDRTAPNLGDLVTYTISLSNAGPDAATGAKVLDVLPAGLRFVSSTATRGGYDSTTGVWNVGSVAVGAPQTLTLVARVVASGVATNTATVQAADQFDPVGANNSASAASTPLQADLGVAVAVSKARPNVNESVTFTVTLANAGPGAATGVAASALLPAGYEFVSATPSAGAYDSESGAWTIGGVANGASVTLAIVAVVTTPDQAVLTASVSATSAADPSGGNNSASVTVAPLKSDLRLVGVVSDSNPNVNDVITITLTLTNDGPDAATHARINNLTAPGLTFVGGTGPGSFNLAEGRWDVGSLASGASAVVVLRARVDAATTVEATADASADQYDPVATNNQAPAIIVVQRADLAVGLTVDNATPDLGDVVEFTVTVTNNGPDAASGVKVLDLLPAGLAYASSTTSAGTYGRNTGVWNLGSLASGASATLKIRATVTGAATVLNTAAVQAVAQYDGNVEDNAASVLITPRQAALTLTMAADVTAPVVDQVVTITTSLANAGPDISTGAKVYVPIPEGYELVSVAAGQGSYDGEAGIWTVGDVDPAGTASLAFAIRVASPKPIVVSSSLVAANQSDTDAGDNSTSVTITPQVAGLKVVGSVDIARPLSTDYVTVTFTLTNDGPDAATNVVVQAPVPGVYFLDSLQWSAGVADPSTGVWTIDALASGESATLTYVLHSNAASPAPVIATIVAGDQFDPSDADNIATVAVSPQQVNLVVAMVVNDPEPNVNDTITYTVVLTNNGPDDATGIFLLDSLPSGVTYLSSTADSGTFDNSTGEWDVGDLASGAQATLVISVRVDDPDTVPSLLLNQIELESVNQYDTRADDNSAETSVEPQQAELYLTHAVDVARPDVGDTVTFTLTLHNLGPNAAENVTVADLLPAGLTFSSATAGSGSYDDATGVWSLASIAGGSTAVLNVVAVVESPAALDVEATITHADQFDPVAGDNASSVHVDAIDNDLAISQVVDTATPNVGDMVTVTITLANNGPDAAEGVVLAAALPAGLDFTSAVPAQGTYDPATGRWTVGSLAPSASTTIVLVGKVTAIGTLAVSATVFDSDHFDTDTSNDTASLDVTPQVSDLSLAMTVDDAAPDVGQVVAFTLTVTNNGPDAAGNVSVADLLPAGFTFVSASPGAGTYDSVAGLWSIPALGGEATATLVLRAIVTTTSAATHSAAIAGADQYDSDASNGLASATVIPKQADVSVSIAVDDAAPNVGDIVTLTVVVANDGPDSAPSVVLDNLLPAGLTILSGTAGQGIFTPGNGTWTVGDVASGGSFTLVLTARVNDVAPMTASVQLEAPDRFDPDAGNDSASVAITPQYADLSVSAAVDDASPNVGQQVTFTFTATNDGIDAATGVRLVALLPAGFTFVSATPGAGVYDAVTGVWTIPSIASGDSTTLTVTAIVNANDATTTLATISGADQFDPAEANNAAQAGVTPQESDLGLTLTADVTRPVPDQLVTFTLTLTDSGPDDSTGVSIAFQLPPGLEYVSDGSGGDYDPITGTWTVGTVATGTPRVLTVVAKAVGTAATTPTATITASDQSDPSEGDRGASLAIEPEVADLGLAVSVDNDRPEVDDLVEITVTLTNHGPDVATGISTTILLPAGLTYVSDDGGPSDYTPGTGSWTAANLAGGESVTLVIKARVTDPSASTVTATVATLGEFDDDSANDTGSIVVTPHQSDLSLGLAADVLRPLADQLVTLSLTLTNHGPDPTGAGVTFQLPAGLTFVSDDSGGTYDPATGTWTVANVASGTPLVLTVVVRATGSADSSPTATIDASGRYDATDADRTASVSISPMSSDLGLTNAVDVARPEVDGVVTFTVTLTNSGPDDATGVVAEVALPAGLAFDSDDSSGAYSPATGVWTVGSLASGASITLKLKAKVALPDASEVIAHVSALDQFDTVPSNAYASATVTPGQSDLALTVAADVTEPVAGQLVTFTLTLTNSGPDEAAGAGVTFTLPAGLTLVSDDGSGTYDPATGTWAAGNVAPGTPLVLHVVTQATGPGASTPTATLNPSGRYDPTPGDRTSTVTIDPRTLDLALTNAVDVASPEVGDVVTFTVTVTNAGPEAATGATATVPLPAGLAFVSSTSEGAYDSATGAWTIGSLASGASATLTLKARVTAPGVATVSASLTGVDQFDLDATNQSSSATVTPHQADLALTMAVDVTAPVADQLVTFTLTLTDSGPDDATGVSVAFPLPPGLEYVSDDSGGTYDPATGTWAVGTATFGTPLAVHIVTRATGSGISSPTATITGSDQFDPDGGDRTATATIRPKRADLGVTNAVSEPRPTIGVLVTFTVTLSNGGPDDATNATVHIPLPAGLILESSTPAAGSYNPATGVWSVPTLASGGSTTLTLTARPGVAATLDVSATVMGLDQFDDNAANASQTATLSTQSADLSMTLTADVLRPVAGQLVTFTLTLTDAGPDVATGVAARFLLPAGLELVSTDAQPGTYVPATGLWTVGVVSAEVPRVLRVVARSKGPAGSVATASVIASDQHDPDSGDLAASLTITPRVVNLSLSLAANQPRPEVGEEVTYTLLVANNGPDEATQTKVVLALPAGLQFVAIVPSQAAYDASTGGLTIPSIFPGGTATILVKARVTSPSPSTLIATLISTDAYQANPARPSASSSVAPRLADVGVAIDPTPTAVVGSVVPVRVLVTDHGPDAARGVSLRLNLPAGLRLANWQAGQGTLDPATGVWTVGDLPDGGSATLTLMVEVLSAGDHTLSATLLRGPRLDPSGSNDTASGVVLATARIPDADAVLGGLVFDDADGDRVADPGERGISGEVIDLEGTDLLGNPVARSVVTGADGTYRFDGLMPGTYVLVRRLDGVRSPAISLAEGEQSMGRDFAVAVAVGDTPQQPPAASRLAGRVYYDLNHDGVFGAPDFGIAGVSVALTGVDDLGRDVTLSVLTGADGTYAFEGLRPGVYSLSESQPAFFRDFCDNLGNLGGVASNDRFTGIVTVAGADGRGYNFGELQPVGSNLRGVALRAGQAYAALMAERSLAPGRFDARHQRVGALLARAIVPWGVGKFPAGPASLIRAIPTLGTRRVILGHRGKLDASLVARTATGKVRLNGAPR